MKLMYDLWILVFSFISHEEYSNFRLVNREFNEVYQHFLKIQQYLDPVKHVFVEEDSLQIYNFQEMVIEDNRKFVRFRKGRGVVIRSLKFKRDGTPYCKDPERKFNIFKTERKYCNRCDGFTYCKNIIILDYHYAIHNYKKKYYRYINNQSFHKHIYCVRCRRLFNHILKIYEECEKSDKWWKEKCDEFELCKFRY